MINNKLNINNSLNLKQNNYISSFDGLRTIAVIFVTLYHLTPHIFSGGYLGVVIFLVMSGYLVTDNFLTEIDNTRYLDILKFWKKRLLKLYIPLIPMLIITSLVILISNDMLTNYIGNFFSSLLGFNNIYQIINGLSYFEAYGNINPFTHLWSLGLEIQFYLIWPIFITLAYNTLRIKRKNLAIIVFILSIFSASLMFYLYSPETDVSRLYYGVDTRAFSFLIGAMFGILFPRKKVLQFNPNNIQKFFINLSTIILTTLSIYLLITLDAKLDIVFKYGMYLFSIIIAILMILLLIKENFIAKILSANIFEKIGKRSYSLYLWQYPIIVFINSIFTWTKIPQIIIFLIQITIIILVSELSFKLLEKGQLHIDNNSFDKSLKISISLLSIFIILTTSVTSLTKNNSDTEILKNKIAEIENKTKENEKEKESIVNNNSETQKITFIGDSVMLSAKEEIEKEFENSIVDAKISRQHWHLEEILKELKSKDQIYDIVVIHLGTNYKINKTKYMEVLKTLENKKIYLINCVVPQPWESQVNSTILEISNEMENVKVIDWYSEAKEKQEWFYKDGTHPNNLGAQEYSKLIKKELNK